MLTELHIRHFKSHRDSRLPLADLTVLVGANASGKSNALEALAMLAWVARGQRLSDLAYVLSAGELALRGTAVDMSSHLLKKPQPISISARFEEPTSGAWGPEIRVLELDLTLTVREGAMRVEYEALRAPNAPGGLPLYEVERPASLEGTEMIVSYNNFARGGKKPKIPAIDQQPVFTQLTTPARLQSGSHNKSARLIPAACRAVRETLVQTLMLDPVPRLMRDYSFPHERELQSDGRNLSSVLYNLDQEGRSGEILDFIRRVPEQDIRGLDFVQGPRGEVMVRLMESFGGQERPVDATLLSDGTLRTLAVAAALLAMPSGGLVVMEELDNGVHPSRAGELLGQIERTAQQRGLRVLVTTHNPALMDALSADAMDNALICFRDTDSGHSRVIRLSDLERYASLVAQGTLGSLVTRGVLRRYLPGLTEEEVDPGHWLESLLSGEQS